MTTDSNVPVSVFADHIATYAILKDEKGTNYETEFLRWKKPEDSHYMIYYFRHAGTLCVYGDCYEAIYQWSGTITLQRISTFGLDYFAEKCRASPQGYKFETWDRDVAEKTLRGHFDEFNEERYGPDFDEEREYRAKELQKFEDTYGWDAIGSREEWMLWCNDHAYDVFGDDWYEGAAGDPGMVIDPRCKLHLEGLRMAFLQLKEQGLLEEQKDDGEGKTG
jgi:hypothetical protein